MWLITSSTFQIKGDNLNYRTFKNYKFFCDCDTIGQNKESQINWLYTGNIYQRKASFDKAIQDNTTDLLCKYYLKYNKDFIHHVKGNFIIIQLQSDCFTIYSDRFGIRKFFYYRNDKEFVISDNLKEILRFVKGSLSKVNICIYALTYHFIGGTTIFENIQHNIPAQIIELKGGMLNSRIYWHPTELLNLSKQRIEIRDISECLVETVKRGLNGNSSLSLSLTGGADTRNLLAVFLKLGVQPHLYTYGNPASVDSIKASKIAKSLNLYHTIHDIQMDEETFEVYAQKIIWLSGGLASIHRSHRLIAVEKERKFAREMFLGTLGGEFIKGVSEDDYIVPSIVFDNWHSQSMSQGMLEPYFQKKSLRYNEDMAARILGFLNEEAYFQGSAAERKLSALTYITAHLHDAQDINLYSTIMNEVFTPFLDIDYLELIFSSEYAFNRKELIKNQYLKRIENPVFASRFLKETYKPLLRFCYSGEHRPSEILLNKYLAAIIKTVRQKLHSEYLPNFTLDIWMESFVKKNLPKCHNYNILRETFDIDLLMNDLANKKHLPKESFWLKFTNPIMMRFIIEELNS